MPKKYLKGFNHFGYIPVTTNTPDSYTATGDKTLLIGARTCAPTDNKEEYSIPGDDGIYDSGSDWTSTTLVVTVNEMSLEQLADLSGVELSGTSGNELEEGIFTNPPEYALTFSALRSDNGYRLYRYYAAKCTGYNVSHSTKGSNNDAQTYELTFACTPRACDGKIRGTTDVTAGAALSWLDTIPNGPDPEPDPEAEEEALLEELGEDY